MIKNDDFKPLRGFADRRTDICECRVVFATENYIHDLLVWGDDVVQNIFLFSSLQKHNFTDETFQTYRSAYFHFIHYLH